MLKLYPLRGYAQQATSFLLFNNCSKESFTFPSAKDVPIDAKERVEKNIEEGRGFSLGTVGKRGGTFDFASSNELWRASIEILDFVPLTTADYSGGVIITDWYNASKKIIEFEADAGVCN